ncbi:MAG: hypothetical protein V7K49_15550 [Nostoc sp.]
MISSQSLKPFENRQKSVLRQTEMSNSQSLKPFEKRQKSVLMQTDANEISNEAETCAELIDPALKAAGWDIIEGSRIRRELIAPGRLVGNGKRAQSDIADYVLVYSGEKLAVIEAKKYVN